jgi:nicotinamide riboside kinase
MAAELYGQRRAAVHRWTRISPAAACAASNGPTIAAVADARRLKIAFIGTHGVGKTTLCYGLAARLKARDVVLEIVHEVARRCPLPINRETGLASQSWILHTQLAEELVASARYPVVLCDRSVLDNYVYLLLAAGRQPALETLVESWMTTYDLLVMVPVTGAPSPDGLRATDPEFQRAVADRVERELDRRGLPALRLGPDDRDAWLDRVEREALARLAPPQLPLL